MTLADTYCLLSQLMCGDFNDSNDDVHRLVTTHGFTSVFGHMHGREARVTHCNHNNREVGVDFIFGAHLHGTTSAALAPGQHRHDTPPFRAPVDRLKLVPTACHLLPRRLPDVARLKRPRFVPDWSAVRQPEEYASEDALVEYWRMVSDHRPLVASFDVLGSPVGAPTTGQR